MDTERSLESFLVAQGYTALPMRKSVIGHFEVEGQIENKPVLWLVDTGASKTVLDKGSAVVLGLQSEGMPMGGIVGTTETAVTHVAVNKAAIGSVP